MSTQVTRDTVIGIGAGHKASLLLEQAGYTLDLARKDNSALFRFLPDGYLDKLTAVITLVRDALRNPAFTPVEFDGPALAAKHPGDLPEEVREFYYRKGSLFIAVKVINGAGRLLHLRDPAAAARYNLRILNRQAIRPPLALTI
jgi:hypothetical protein